MKTKDNLMEAFAGESQANRKYAIYSLKAEKEGFKNVARLFKAVSDAEAIHARKHLEVAGKVGSTLENLTAAMEGEQYEFSTMYPEFIETAKAEGQDRAEKTFDWANEAEKVHGKTYGELKELVASGNDLEDQEIHLCPVCGWVGIGHAPDNCPICNTPAKMFKQY